MTCSKINTIESLGVFVVVTQAHLSLSAFHVKSD